MPRKTVLLLASLLTLACSSDSTSPPKDTSPAQVTDLMVLSTGATSVTLQWTAPGDDGMDGTAASYELRTNDAAMKDTNFDKAMMVTGLSAPSTGGSVETFTVDGLDMQLVHYFALRATDTAGNHSTVSNNAIFEPGGPDAVGAIHTWAGTGTAGYDGDNHEPLQTKFYWPVDVEFTPSLGTYVVDWNNHRIRKLNGAGKFETVVGIQIPGDGPYPPESDLVAPGAPGTDCGLNHPTQVLERLNGKLLIVCWHNHKLREWDPATGKVMVLSGRGPGCTGDGSLASDPTVLFSQPPHAVEAPDGSLYINDQRNQCIRKIDASGMVSTVVSTPQCNPADSNEFLPGGFGGDGGPPTGALLNQPSGPNPNPPGGGLALDDQGRLYIADTLNHRIRRADFNANVITTVAGNGTAAYGGDGGDPLAASLNTPLDIAFGPDGRLYIADTYNNRIRAVDFNANVITTVAGNGTASYGGDGGPAVAAKLHWPYGVGFDADGQLYIADTYNHRIRRVKLHD